MSDEQCIKIGLFEYIRECYDVDLDEIGRFMTFDYKRVNGLLDNNMTELKCNVTVKEYPSVLVRYNELYNDKYDEVLDVRGCDVVVAANLHHAREIIILLKNLIYSSLGLLNTRLKVEYNNKHIFRCKFNYIDSLTLDDYSILIKGKDAIDYLVDIIVNNPDRPETSDDYKIIGSINTYAKTQFILLNLKWVVEEKLKVLIKSSEIKESLYNEMYGLDRDFKFTLGDIDRAQILNTYFDESNRMENDIDKYVELINNQSPDKDLNIKLTRIDVERDIKEINELRYGNKLNSDLIALLNECNKELDEAKNTKNKRRKFKK